MTGTFPHLFKADRIWEGQRCFIVGGGPSVLGQDMDRLRGRNVIAINSSYIACPWAPWLVWSDSRWWYHHEKRLKDFKGKIVGASHTIRDPRSLRMNRKHPGLSSDPVILAIRYTTLTAAINLGVHFGCKSIVLLGADGKVGADGKTHHHEKHPWRQIPNCWDQQKKDLVKIAADLRSMGIDCVNASPGSAWADIWPIVNLEDYLDVGVAEPEPALEVA